MTNWDILLLDEESEWSHIALLDHLHQNNIDCYFADIWKSTEVAFLVGCKAGREELACALNMHQDAIYMDSEHCFVILNLFQEKILRGE